MKLNHLAILTTYKHNTNQSKSYWSHTSYTILFVLLTLCLLLPTLYLLSFISSHIQLHLVLLYYCPKFRTLYLLSYTSNNWKDYTCQRMYRHRITSGYIYSSIFDVKLLFRVIKMILFSCLEISLFYN